MTLETAGLKIIPCDAELLAIAVQGGDALEERLKVTVPDNWTEFGVEALQYSKDKLSDKDESGWWTYFPVHKTSNALIGSGGYKGKPTGGMVEIGYEIAEDYRNRGLATEFVSALVENAFSFEEVTSIIAHTLAARNASARVLEKTGFSKISDLNDPDHGLIWRWELKRK